MPDDLGERTEEATPRRRQEARRDGNVAKSQDLAAAVLLIAVTLAVWAATMPMLGQAKGMVESALAGDRVSDPRRVSSAYEAVAAIAPVAVRIALPMLLIAWGAAYLAHFLQIGWLLTSKPIQPSLEKLNVISGLKRIAGLSAFVKGGLDLLKVVVIVIVATATIVEHAHEVVVLPYLTALQAAAGIARVMLDLALRVLAVLLLLGIIDFAYQRWKHRHDLRMTKQQVKDELKQTEGDPETKRRRLRMQQQVAMQRISAAVPKADVIVTNPEHVSIAIRYEQDAMHAPKVIAKGADLLAMRIRQLAARHGVPIVQRPPLARALYRQVPVGREIPPEFYQAVAEILAYVYRLGGRAAG